VSVYHQDDPDKYTAVETVKTMPGSKTMALDPRTKRLFLPSAKYKPAPAATADNPRPRPMAEPGSFAVLVYGK
jgi:hypothetical protein